jgi:hypothetical protein
MAVRTHKSVGRQRLVDAHGLTIGFAMPLIDLAQSVELELLLHRAGRRAEKLPEQYGFRLTVARNLAAVFTELNALGHYIIDAKPINLRVYRGSAVMAVLDCDGFHITGADGARYPASHFTEGHIAPESANEKPEALGVKQDDFALALMIFQLLNNGLHPYQGTFKPGKSLRSDDVQSRINAYSFPYGRNPDLHQAPSPLSIHEYLPDDTLAFFEQAFRGSSRPTALSWRDHLDRLIQRAQPCAKEPLLHIDFGKGCGLCFLEKKIAQISARPHAPSRPIVGTAPPTQIVYNTAPAIAKRKASSTGQKWAIALGVLLFFWVAANLGGNNRAVKVPTPSTSPSVDRSTSPRTLPSGTAAAPVASQTVPSPVVASVPGQTVRSPTAATVPSQTIPSPAAPVPSQTVPTVASPPRPSLDAVVSLQPEHQSEPYVADLVAIRNVNLREGPSETARILSTIVPGTSLASLSRRKADGADWLLVKNGSGIAYVMERFTSPRDQWVKVNTVRGKVEQVQDSETVLIAGRPIKLSGIEVVPGSFVAPLFEWLQVRGGVVECVPVQELRYQCYTESNRDIAQAAILNGFAIASKTAPAEYRESEAEARQARRGYWSNRP